MPAYKDALLYRNYNKHCFSKENFTVPKYNTLHSSSSVKSINLTNIPAPRQLLQKNYLIRFSDFRIINHFAQQMGSRKDATVSQKTRMTCTLAIFGEKSQTFVWHRINTSIRGQVWQSVLDGSESLNPRSIPAGRRKTRGTEKRRK